MPETTARKKYTLTDLIKYFLKLGALGFGGPVALVGYMDPFIILAAALLGLLIKSWL